MTTYQTGKNISVAYRAESAFGTAPGTGSAYYFRASPSSGLALKKANITPGEFRKDGMSPLERHGSRSVEGQYDADLSQGTFDPLFEAALRGTWATAFTITQADVTSITTPTTSTIVAASGSWLSLGVRVGMVFRLTGFATAANNSINLTVKTVTATTITVYGTPLVVDNNADTSITLTFAKYLVQADPPTARSFYIEEYLQDIDGAELFSGCRVTGMTLSFKPDATVQVTFRFMGQDQTNVTGASAPYYVTPTLTTAVPLVCVDGTLRVNGAAVTNFTSLDITYNMGGQTVPVVGSTTTPDVFLNNARITGSLSGLRSDFTASNLFLAETNFEISVLCVENESEPKDFTHFYFGACKYMGNDGNIGNDGAFIETLPISIGKDETGTATGHAPTMMMISSSAA